MSGISAAQLDFSPDGQWVAYVEYPEGVLWRSRVDGSQRLQLTTASLYATMPRWSPDGNTIAFQGAAPGKPLHSFLISAQGGNPEAILPETNKQEDDANWSSDSKNIILSLGPLFGNSPSDFEILLVDVQTRQVSRLTDSVGLFGPRFSPDGRYISAFTTDAHRLMLFDLQSRHWSELLSGAALQYPEWSRDSAYIYFADTKENVYQIKRVRIADRRVETIVGVKGITMPSLPYGDLWHGVTPDGSPLILREVGVRELYSLELDLP
jgi:dipeptidyl aminopeptidase/acylaminoacyl peptidase